MIEREVEKKFVQGVKKLGGLCLKWVSPGYSGVPDRIVLLPYGAIFLVELKRKGEVLRPRQRVVHKAFKKRGINVHTLKGEDEVKEFLEMVETAQKVLSAFAIPPQVKRSYGEIVR